MNKRVLIFRLIVVTALVGAVVWLGLHSEFLQAPMLERQLGRFGKWAPIVFVVLYALSTVLFVPGSLLTLAGGALFGPVAGTLCNLTGATLGATLAFMIARYVASDWVSSREGERLAALVRGVEEDGWRFVAFVRLVPLFPFNLVNYAFGATRIHLGEYVIASFVCMAPGALAYTYLGYAGGRGRVRAGWNDPQSFACLGATRGHRFPAAAGSSAQGSALHGRSYAQALVGVRKRSCGDRRPQR
jgi:uncharacterized membrane protein YdjX (TVP38/TMEM64 family)